MKKELTPWVPAEVQPVRVGVYRVDPGWSWLKGRAAYSYWDGRRFNWVTDNEVYAYRMSKDHGAGSDVKFWRGLAKKP